jgi:molybdopterin-guanine dinucleotide biosynthesis protein MobB
MDSYPVPLLAFSAYSGSGKTTLLEQVVPELRRLGLRIAMIKHTHHQVDLDQPGKDSYRMRQAGANPVMIASNKRWVLLFENEQGQDEPQLRELVLQLNPAMFDLILVEGFKHEPIPKIEIIRRGVEKPPLHPNDSSFIAIASDLFDLDTSLPVLNLNNPSAIADFIFDWMKTHR